MTLGEKLRSLREVEGTLRGLGRPMSQSEVARGIRDELKENISQAYLSQVENGRRKHLTETSRMVLSRFFNVHPGHLVSDPEGYQTELMSPVRAQEDSLDLWLIAGAERFSGDMELSAALVALARSEDSRRCLVTVGRLAAMPNNMVERLSDALKPRRPRKAVRKGGKRK